MGQVELTDKYTLITFLLTHRPIMSDDKKVVLVTGGSGLVGHGIKAAWEAEKRDDEELYFASSKDANLCDKEATRKMFERVGPTHVIHLAAKVGGLYGNMKANLEFFRMNMAINDNVLSL